ncbi:hypothetical protein LTR62_007424 [Meristemomyces frigidus]|uniref:Kelch repeat protein n=1 Tax=Meristemomyces frigidus TaxID=1508187 RepID=A0AAN7YMH9_9PEZI|nr:hypothetical protein LTR62_007424 [Meristemomyces frigidus]
MSLNGHWVKLAQSEGLTRSSLCASVVDSSVYIFGGELEPRKPRDSNTYKVDITSDSTSHVVIVAASSPVPSPRVGASSTSLNGRIYMFSGRGGEAMAPVEEKGHMWEFEPARQKWTSLAPKSDAFPEARSYFCMTNNGSDTVYVHAGCPEKGRLSDLWAFNVRKLEWAMLASAPAPPRGGPSIAFVDGEIYRMNGFDGKSEQGGSLDIYSTATNEWSTHTFEADGKSGPGARSVSALLPVTINGGTYLLTLFGESDPSSLGHLGAGKMLSDAWAFSLADRRWRRVDTSSAEEPQPRGWFDADTIGAHGSDGVVVAGGLGESNERLGDVWRLVF